ncbi:filamentous hemagglutinin N-terminal domain-containing protein [Candidatus Albibeggiatoa sp. nov. NOAA]|uniref:two-partner secretion domain-containing protein n=1 Tax=Candidatus Albibeggiatoa sp. nov. NOAA TaxID=3162724 RepID=UPI0032F985E0|nr:filamentous hemagglutinin N-terminal domain-containing protein [Thiotrichaceae bacterium]
MLLFPTMTLAEIRLHHTGTSVALNVNTTYEIRQAFGQTVGNNLFHTFDQFNLAVGETAHFSGADSIQNIVARVIGGQPSLINGTLRSSIPNADLYFLNPYGIIVGEQAQLDLQGGLHLSTADYVRLGEMGEFHARFPQRDILSSAPISHFGFLTDNPAPISITGTEISQTVAEAYPKTKDDTPIYHDVVGLELNENKAFSVIGGEINITGDFYYKSPEDRANDVKELLPFMYMPSGYINLVSTGSQGEIAIQDNGFQQHNFTQLADIQLADVKIKNTGGGIFIHGQNLNLSNMSLFPLIEHEQLAKDIILRATGHISLSNFYVNSATYGQGDAGNIHISSQSDLVLNEATQLITKAQKDSTGKAGNITLESGQNLILDNTIISSSTLTENNAGNISLTAQGDIDLKNYSRLYSNSNKDQGTGGNAGDITLTSQQDITLTGDAHSKKDTFISTITRNTGDAGNITLNSQGAVTLDNTQLYSNTEYKQEIGGDAGFIKVESQQGIDLNRTLLASSSWNNGHAGSISLKTPHNILSKKSKLYTRTYAYGDAGNILVESQQDVSFQNSYLNSNTYDGGNAGNISLYADGDLSFEATLKNYSTGITSNTYGKGDAGTIDIRANNAYLKNAAFIQSVSWGFVGGQGGNSGDITVNAKQTLRVAGNTHKQRGWISMITSGVEAKRANSATGHGGKIDITANRIELLDGGQITSSSIAALGGTASHGGDLKIHAQDIVLSGVNLHGENEDGFGGGIYARSIGIGGNVGDAGQITVTAQRMLIENGAVIESSTNNFANAGNIDITVGQKLDIRGNSKNVELYEQGIAQQRYLQNHVPHDYNQSTSGIFSQSINQSVNAGKGGSIKIQVPELSLDDHGTISTLSQGGQNAGSIDLKVDRLHLNNQAKITSESRLKNEFVGENDNTLIQPGQIIEVVDAKTASSQLRYVATAAGFIPAREAYQVETETDLNQLADAQAKDIALVKSTQQRFMFYDNTWHQIQDTTKPKHILTANDPALTYLLNYQAFDDIESIPYTQGEIFQVAEQTGQRLYAYQIRSLEDGESVNYLGRLVRLNHYLVQDHAALTALPNTYDVIQGNMAVVKADFSQHYYTGNEWVQLKDTRHIQNIKALNTLQIMNPGLVFKSAGSPSIFTGDEWLPLTVHNETIENLEQSANNGDLISVNNELHQYFYSNQQWHQQVKGGNAGHISISADSISLFNHSQITTEALSAGGGQISLTLSDQLYLPLSTKITTSVKHGFDNGGNLSVQGATFTVLNKGEIHADAHEGNGGDIQITTTGYFVSDKKRVTASSEFGLDGHIQIDTIGSLNSEALARLPSHMQHKAFNLSKPCLINDQSGFSLVPRSGIASRAADWQSAH